MLFCEAEGHTEQGVIRQSCSDPARSEALCTLESHRAETGRSLRCPMRKHGRSRKGPNRNPAVYVAEKLDAPVLPEKPSNKGPSPCGDGGRKGGNQGKHRHFPRGPSAEPDQLSVDGLEGVRKAASRSKGMQFTALLHHITLQLLAQSFYALRREGVVGMDGMSWREYEEIFSWR